MDLYSEIILDYYKHTKNKGDIENPSCTATEHNPLCGDKIKIDLLIEDNKVIKAMYNGEGCAISQASTSMLTEQLIGKSLEEVKEISNEDIYKMLGVEISPGRVKCALLGVVAARNSLKLLNNA